MSKKSGRRRGNPLREWFSDNLRYFLLVLGVFAILLGLFFGVRAVSGRLTGESSSGSYAAGGASPESVKEAVVSGDEEATGAASAGEEAGDIASGSVAEDTDNSAEAGDGAVSAPENAEGSVSAESPDGNDGHGTLAESTEQDVTQVVRDYYAALTEGDMTAVQDLTSGLTAVQADELARQKLTYQDVTVYAKNGPDADSRLIYAYTHYKRADSEVLFPGFSRMFLRRSADGRWRILFSDLNAEENAYVASVTADEDVQKLLAEITDELARANQEAEKEEEQLAEAEAEASSISEAPPTADSSLEEALASDEEETETLSDASGEESQAEEETPPEEDGWTATINSSCNVRAGAGYDYEVIGGVAQGETVTVLGDLENGWWHIRGDYVEGYIGGKFIG